MIPSEVFTEMVASTNRKWGKKLVDNVSENNAFLRFMKKGHMMGTDGGYDIVEQLEYDLNSTYQRFTGADTLNVDADTIMTAVRYPWRQVAINVVANGKELLQNSGEAAMIKIVKARKKNAMTSAANNFAIDLLSDGSLNEQIGGLASIIQNNGQGVVGGINSTNWPFWRNQVQSMGNALTPGNAQSAANPTEAAGRAVVAGLNLIWPRLQFGTTDPELILMSNDMYNALEAKTEPVRRYAREDTAKQGFLSMVYKDTQILRDENTNFASNAEKAYILNMRYMYLQYHNKANWSPDKVKRPDNQDLIILPYYWMGNLICTNRRQQGVLLDT